MCGPLCTRSPSAGHHCRGVSAGPTVTGVSAGASGGSKVSKYSTCLKRSGWALPGFPSGWRAWCWSGPSQVMAVLSMHLGVGVLRHSKPKVWNEGILKITLSFNQLPMYIIPLALVWTPSPFLCNKPSGVFLHSPSRKRNWYFQLKHHWDNNNNKKATMSSWRAYLASAGRLPQLGRWDEQGQPEQLKAVPLPPRSPSAGGTGQSNPRGPSREWHLFFNALKG